MLVQTRNPFSPNIPVDNLLNSSSPVILTPVHLLVSSGMIEKWIRCWFFLAKLLNLVRYLMLFANIWNPNDRIRRDRNQSMIKSITGYWVTTELHWRQPQTAFEGMFWKTGISITSWLVAKPHGTPGQKRISSSALVFLLMWIYFDQILMNLFGHFTVLQSQLYNGNGD